MESGDCRMSEPLAQLKVNDEVAGLGLHVLQELGQGAASVIYLAQDRKTKQIWALKHIHRGSSKDDRFLQQAIYEGKIASQLDHRNIRKIVKIHKKREKLFSVSDVFLVMEYIDGKSMDLSPPKTLTDAVSLFFQTADALKHMHSRGFVHADMKPNNIMIVSEPGHTGPVAKLIDLGQSCTEGTIKERIQGTPDYIAPEQVHRRAITARTDVYNLGATMYAVLSEGKTIPTALAKGDSLVSKLDDSLMVRPQPLAELNPQVPPKLNELVMHCVEVDPGDRPSNMTFVVERLELVLGMLRAKSEQSASDLKANHASGAGLVLKKDGSTVAGVRYVDPTPPGK